MSRFWRRIDKAAVKTLKHGLQKLCFKRLSFLLIIYFETSQISSFNLERSFCQLSNSQRDCGIYGKMHIANCLSFSLFLIPTLQPLCQAVIPLLKSQIKDAVKMYKIVERRREAGAQSTRKKSEHNPRDSELEKERLTKKKGKECQHSTDTLRCSICLS